MNRRNFLSRSAILTTGSLLTTNIPVTLGSLIPENTRQSDRSLYELFNNHGLQYHPFVRWWWNGDKIEAKELLRELRLLKDAGIGGVEINPVEFPKRFDGEDLGRPSLKWLSEEWVKMLKVTFDETRSLGMTSDLIVGSGWPFGAEYLEGEDRAQIVTIGVKKLVGPLEYEISRFEIFREADPAISSINQAGRRLQL